MNKLSWVVMLLLLLCGGSLIAQEGGPPMLTDDARVTDLKEWEMNTSINTSVAGHLTLSVPHIDLNYGILPRLQLKVEAPLLVEFSNRKGVGRVGEIVAGVKYRFFDEEKHFVSAATFPQIYFHENKGYLIPLFVEKTLGKFLVGQGWGYFIGDRQPNNFQWGSIAGFRATEKLHLMVEYFLQKDDGREKDSYLNAGFRYPLSGTFTLMASFGSQISGKPDEREKFISWIGVQTIF